MRMRLIMLASRWMRPACSQVHDSSRHAWFPCTTLYQSRAPYFCSLRRERDEFRDQKTGWGGRFVFLPLQQRD